MGRLAQSPRGTASDAVPHPLLLRVAKDAEGGINHPAFAGGAALPTPSQATCGDLINVEGQGYRWNVRARNLKVLVVDGGKNDLEHPRDGGSRSRGIGEGRAAQRRGVWQKRVEKPRFCENGTPVSGGVSRLRSSPKHQSQTSSSPSISHETDLASCPDQWN